MGCNTYCPTNCNVRYGSKTETDEKGLFELKKFQQILFVNKKKIIKAFPLLVYTLIKY